MEIFMKAISSKVEALQKKGRKSRFLTNLHTSFTQQSQKKQKCNSEPIKWCSERKYIDSSRRYAIQTGKNYPRTNPSQSSGKRCEWGEGEGMAQLKYGPREPTGYRRHGINSNGK